MNIADYAAMDGIALAAAIAKGDVSAAEVTEAAIAAIGALDPMLNAVVMRNVDNGRRAARGPLPGGPLAGVPFLLKDVNLFSHDMPTTFSCRFFADAEARPDSELVARWRRAGLVVLGKTNTPEFAEDFVCEPTFRGVTRNPWNPDLTTGGSSGGAGAAVASGMVPVAHATDSGGSIRIPAACCGVFGLKPTAGLTPMGPYYPELASGFNVDHVLSRSVRDSAAALDAGTGPMRGARYHVRPKVASFLAALDSPAPALRIGVTTRTPHGDRVGPAQEAAVARAVAALEAMGHRLSEYRYPEALNLGSEADLLWMIDVVFEIEERVRRLGREPRHDELDALTRHCREFVGRLGAMDLYRARQGAHEAGMTLMDSMRDLDLVLSPTLGSDPVPVGWLDSRTDAFDMETWIARGRDFAPFTFLCNVTGQPAASLPLQLAPGNHPSAVQLAGHHFDDHIILQVAAQLEEVFGWRDHRPPVWAGNGREA